MAERNGVAMLERNQVYQMDALDLLRQLDDQSVDAFITDLPYGTTACTWDTIIPFEPMWREVKRTLKPRGAFVTTASQPFTSKLVMSNVDWFRYEWIWDRSIVSGFLDANRKPLKIHENILVFSPMAASYYPVMSEGEAYEITRELVPASVYGAHTKPPTINLGWRFPTSILDIPNQQTREHPTQKPVALYEYLIRTYTQPGELVVDFCAGSGTTALAARNLKRDYIISDTDAHYCNVARERLRLPYEQHYITANDDVSDLPLFAAMLPESGD